jgi:hypothetical protein
MRDTDPAGVLNPGFLTLLGTDEVAMQAGGSIFADNFLGTVGGDIFLEADSPDAPNGGDDAGTLTVGAGATIDTKVEGATAFGDLTLIAADFNLSSKLFTNLGDGDVLIAPSTETAFSIGGPGLDTPVFDALGATGQWSLGAALTAPGADDKQSLTVAESIGLDGDVKVSSADALLLAATGDIDGQLTTKQLSARAGDNVDLSLAVGLLEVTTAADGPAVDDLDVDIFSGEDVTVGDVDITLAVDDALDARDDVPSSAPGITAENLLIDTSGTVTFNVAHDVPGKHQIFSTATATVIFNGPVTSSTGSGELFVVSDGDVNFNSSVSGLDLLWVDADNTSDITFGGGGSGLNNVVVGNLPGDDTVDQVVELLDDGKLKDASSLVSNSGDDVVIGGTLAAENLLLKPNGDSSGTIAVQRLLVSGTSATLFGTIQGVGGTAAAFLGISEPIEGGEGPFNPQEFTLNRCEIGANCTGFNFPGQKDEGTPPDPGDFPPQAGDPSLTLPDLLVTKQRVVPDLEGRFSNSGNEEIW